MSMKKQLCCTVLLIFLVAHGHRIIAGEYVREREVGPVRLTYDDMFRLLENVHNIVRPDDSNDHEGDLSSTVKVGDGNVQIEIDLTSGLHESKMTRLPPVAHDLTYSYRMPHGRVESIWLHFSDGLRTISVAGTDPDHVDAAYAYLVNEVGRHAVWLGGCRFRSCTGGALFGLGLLLMMIPGLSRFQTPEPKVNLSTRLAIYLWGIGLAIVITTVTLPYDRWLPGFALYRTSASWLVRRAPEISFIGVLVAVASFAVAAFPLIRWRGQRTHPVNCSGGKKPTGRIGRHKGD